MTQLASPLYTTFKSVQVRLVNKVKFQEDPLKLEQGELPNELLAQIIADAEMSVEQELRSRYAIPFQSASKGTFAALPDHSKRAIRVLVDYKSVLLILKTDFGRGTHISGDSYAKDIEDEYDKLIANELGHDREGKNGKVDRFRRSPPLDDLLLAFSNREADDGFHGMIINTDRSHHDSVSYAGGQINDPSKTYISKLGLRTRGR